MFDLNVLANYIKKKTSGYTLIEVIVSLAVIGILFAISIVSYGDWSNRVASERVKSDLAQISTAFEGYRNLNSSYPTDISKISSFKVSSDITINIVSSSSDYYCVNAFLAINNISFHVSSTKKEIQIGPCADLRWRIVDGGLLYACAVSLENRVYCWGDNEYGNIGDNSTNSTVFPIPISQGSMKSLDVKTISVGENHACVIGFDDKAYCWGQNDSGQLGNGTDGNSSVPVAVSIGQMNSLNVKKISTGSDYTCAIGFDDKAYCWGRNDSGQLGDGTNNSSQTPIVVLQGSMLSSNVKSISSGYYHTCAIGFDDKAYCWGSGYSGQLGNGVGQDSLIPVSVSMGGMTSLNVKSITLGAYYTCSIGFDDKVYCWGSNEDGMLGKGDFTGYSLEPIAVIRGSMTSLLVKNISAGETHTCVVGWDENAYCWGNNEYGQLGDKSMASSSFPVKTAKGQRDSLLTKSIYGTERATYVIDKDNALYGFGLNSMGSLGVGIDGYNIKIPKLTNQGSRAFLNAKSISSGNNHTCAIGSDDVAYCWGDNSAGELGNGNTNSSIAPVSVSLGERATLKVKAISAGPSHTCVIGFDNKAYCWGGRNWSGKIGDGTQSTRLSPVAVSLGERSSLYVKSISVGDDNTCAIDFDNKAYCWGQGYSGQIGNGLNQTFSTPRAIVQGDMPSINVKSISVGMAFICAIGFDDKVYCWGYNNRGQLGNGTSTSSSIPRLVSQGSRTLMTARDVVSGSYRACLIDTENTQYCWGGSVLSPAASAQGAMPSNSVKSISGWLGSHACSMSFDNKLYCRGDNNYGQLGDGSSDKDWHLAVAVKKGGMISQEIKSVSVGGRHTCVIGVDDLVYCWGDNYYGQLGFPDNSLISTSLPIKIINQQ